MNNTIEVLQEIRKYYAQDIIRGIGPGSKRFDAINQAIANEEALESAGDMLPEKSKDEHFVGGYVKPASEGFNQAIDLCHPILAKQILKVKGLEKSISDVLTQRDMWKTDYAELQAENKKLKEQQLKLDCENNLTEDEIVEVMTKEYSRDKHFINNKNYSNATLNVIFSEKKLIAKAIIKAREEKNG